MPNFEDDSGHFDYEAAVEYADFKRKEQREQAAMENKGIDQIIKDEEPARAASIKAHNERPINWDSSFIARDGEGNPLVCGCGMPVGIDYPYPVAMKEYSCYLCTSKWMTTNNMEWPEELKPGESHNALILGQRLKREPRQ